MAVRIVTDSTADIPPDMLRRMGITVVPVYVRFGDEVYRDLVDIDQDEFYHKLKTSPHHPATSQPSPSDFDRVYRELAAESDEIASIHLTSKLSGTYESALRGREMAGVKSAIEVIDTGAVSMGLGLAVMTAAQVAAAGGTLRKVAEEVRRALSTMHLFGLLDTLKYLHRGGRIGRVKTLLGAVLNVKPMLTMRDGELIPMGLVRSRKRGLERLVRIAREMLDIEEMALVYATDAAEAGSMREEMSAFLPADRIHISRLGPALGAHAGPDTLILAIMQKTEAVGARLQRSLRERIRLPSLRG